MRKGFRLLAPALILCGAAWGWWAGSLADIPEFDAPFWAAGGAIAGLIAWLFVRFASFEAQRITAAACVLAMLVPIYLWSAGNRRGDLYKQASQAAALIVARQREDSLRVFSNLELLTGWDRVSGDWRQKTYRSQWDLDRTRKQLEPLGLGVLNKRPSPTSFVGAFRLSGHRLSIIAIQVGGYTRCEVAFAD